LRSLRAAAWASLASATIGGEALRFCCYGCVLAQQVTRAKGEPGAAAILVRLGLGILRHERVALSLPTYAPYVYTAPDLVADGPLFQILRLLSAVFALPVIVLLGGPVVLTALRSLRDRVVTADALIVLGAAAAYALSLTHVFQRSGEVYFDTAAMLLVIVTLGRYLEARARSDATALVKRSLCPTPERSLRLIEGRGEIVLSADLVPGDMIRVTPGDAFPTDGIVLRGAGAVDESMLTGESRPIRKDSGARVAGGTCSIDGTLEVLVSAEQSESAAARISLAADALRRAVGLNVLPIGRHSCSCRW
jgi:cation transport ATPase